VTPSDRPVISALVVDDREGSYDNDSVQLKVGLENVGIELRTMYCDTIEKALGLLPRGQQQFQLVVSDLFFPDPAGGGDPEKQIPRFDVIRQAAMTEGVVVVALTVGGDRDYHRLDQAAADAGAHLFAYRGELHGTDPRLDWSSLIRDIHAALTDAGIVYGAAREAPLPDEVRRVEHVCRRFPRVAHRLAKRPHSDDVIAFTDEYAVQYVLGGLLAVDFEDIRPEEVAPSVAGKSTRMDFLIEPHGIVVEVKRPRDVAHAQKIRGELIEDIAHYRTHPRCEFLVCLVYDPGGYIGNPTGFERDLASVRAAFKLVPVVTTTG
jgi:hypothetical protein